MSNSTRQISSNITLLTSSMASSRFWSSPTNPLTSWAIKSSIKFTKVTDSKLTRTLRQTGGEPALLTTTTATSTNPSHLSRPSTKSIHWGPRYHTIRTSLIISNRHSNSNRSSRRAGMSNLGSLTRKSSIISWTKFRRKSTKDARRTYWKPTNLYHNKFKPCSTNFRKISLLISLFNSGKSLTTLKRDLLIWVRNLMLLRI